MNFAVLPAAEAAALVAHLLGLKYRLYLHQTPAFTPTNYFGNPVNVYGRTGTSNMICLPVERPQSLGSLYEITDPAQQFLPPPK